MTPSFNSRGLILFLGDIVLITAATQLSGILRFGTDFNIFDYFTGASTFTFMLYLIVLYIFDMYNTGRTYQLHRTVLRVGGAVVFAGLLSTFLFFMLPSWKYIRGLFVFQMALVCVLLTAWRWLFSFAFHIRGEKENVLIIGAGYAGVNLFQMLEDPASPFRPIGFLDDDLTKQAQVRGFSSLLGTIDKLSEIAALKNIKTAILAIPHNRSAHVLQQLFTVRFKGMTILDMPAVVEKLIGLVPVNHIREDWFIFAPGFYLLSSSHVWKIKRLIDMVGSIFLMLVSFPVFMITAAAIRLESSGPIFFKQKRVGKENHLFTIWKFRSMVQNAESNGAVWACENDSRITRVGKWIRLLRIDELPQLFNVLRGDMSLIGPRPERPEFVNDLEQQIPYYRIRHCIRPGITGWAQLNYRYGASVEDARHKLEYDLYYIKSMSVLLDFNILFKTIGVVIFGQGAR